MAARWIKVQVNSGSDGILRFGIAGDNSVSRSPINAVVSGTRLLKYKDIHSDNWNT